VQTPAAKSTSAQPMVSPSEKMAEPTVRWREHFRCTSMTDSGRSITFSAGQSAGGSTWLVIMKQPDSGAASSALQTSLIVAGDMTSSAPYGNPKTSDSRQGGLLQAYLGNPATP
jgi:hypothetical protein